MRPIAWCLAAAALLTSAGCSSGPARSDAEVANRRPAAYHPESFPDVPFTHLNGYRLAAGEDQIALSTAGGALRRLSVSFVTRPGDEARPPLKELDRLAGGMGAEGWQREAPPADAKPDPLTQRWVKGDERLLLHAESEDDATLITFRLEPRTVAAATTGSP